ncbi:MAG: long-chain-fatty-acid--CoA ligase [Candidatus Hodarchaeales archaeon]|jgi:long-chain acyl-CoA synthetase
MEEMIWHKHKWLETVKKSIMDEYPDEPLYKILDKTAEKSGDLVFTVFLGFSTTYTLALDHANSIANFLISKGVKKGERVAIFMANTPHYPMVFFGILKAGGIPVTCNPHYKASELKFQLKDTGTKVIFVLDYGESIPTCYEAIKETEVENVAVCSGKDYQSKEKVGLSSRIPKSPSTTFYSDIITNYESKAPPEPDINPEEDLALILYTGGTTGTPKGAMLTHKNLYCNILQQHEYIQIIPEDGGLPERMAFNEEVFIGALPWYHSYGLTLTMIASVYHAGKLIPIPDPRAGNPPLSVILEAVHEHGGTILHAVPSLYAAMVNHPNVKDYDLTSIKACGSGAAPLPPEVAKRFEEVTGADLYEGYGLTETSPMTHGNPTMKHLRKFGSVGFPIPDTYVKIVDLETGMKEMAVGDVGEIALSGPQVMKGYWKKPEETKAVFRELDGKRFFLTGDIGHLDEEGYTIITDRKKDMINVSGLKAYPREIEDKLYEHPKIALAAAVGLPREDDPGNEYVKAFLVLKDGEQATEEEIIEWCRERMAGYKRPKEVEFRDKLPLSTVGKVLRRVLQDEEREKKK